MRIACTVLLLLIVSGAPLNAGKFNPKLNVGDAGPVWKDLPGVDGKTHSLGDLKQSEFVVVFFHSCSCPVAEDYEQRIIDFTDKYAQDASRVSVVGINVSKLEEDRLPAMKERAEKKKFNFPYLFDESQQIAKQYGAAWTPEFFILNRDREVVYMGGFDDSSNVDRVKKNYLAPAMDSLLAGKAPETAESPAIGCRIRFERKRRSRRARPRE